MPGCGSEGGRVKRDNRVGGGTRSRAWETLEAAIRDLRSAADERRLLRRGTREYGSALVREVQLAAAVGALAREVRSRNQLH